jgi:hypothetical protein
VTLNANGSFTYTPAANYNGPDAFTYKAKDALLYSNVATVSITVNPVNDAPVARDTSLTTNQDTPASLGYLPTSDPDAGQALTFAILNGPWHGSVSGFDPATGAFTYTPAAGYSGPDSVKFQVCDNGSPVLCDSGMVRITVVGTGGQLASRIVIRPFAWQPTKKASPSSGRVNCWIGNLAGGHGVAEILASSIRLNGTVPILEGSAKIVGFDEGFTGPVLMVSFDRQLAMASLGPVPPGMYTVAVTGALTGGATFRGVTEVMVPGSPKTMVEENLPFDFELGQSYPNPANPSANIEFALPYDGETRLEVFDILGRRVRTLVDGFRMAGRQTVTWDGRDANGNEVSSGVYLYRLVFDQSVQTKKLILLK